MFILLKTVFVGMLIVAVMAGEPKACKISHLNGTANGESWTPSVNLQSQVAIALKNPNLEPWQEINIEFESAKGANIGTLQLKNTLTDSTTKLTLSSWATKINKQNSKSQILEAKGHAKEILRLEEWTYINVSSAGIIKVAIGNETLTFNQVNAEPFTALYVRVQEGQNLDVGFNCIEELLQTITTPLPGPGEGSSMVITIVGIIAVLLLIGIGIFWYMGRRKSNALAEKRERDAREREECGDLVQDESASEDESSSPKAKNLGKTSFKNDIKKCDDCGDMITDDETPFSKDKKKGLGKGVTVKKENGIVTKSDDKKCEDCGDMITDDETPSGKGMMKVLAKKVEFKKEIKTATKGDEVDGECSCSDEEHK